MPDDDQRHRAERRPPRLRAADSDRDAVLEILTAAHGSGRLDPTEVNERQDQALAARFVDELPALVDDLPEGRDFVARHDATGDALPALAGSAALPVRPGSGDTERTVAILSGKTVDVDPGTPRIVSYILMGGDEIHLGRVMGPGVEITVETWSMWGGSEVYVPPGVKVVDKMLNILAGNDIDDAARGDGSNGTLVLTGMNLMAGHEVKLEPEKSAKKR